MESPRAGPNPEAGTVRVGPAGWSYPDWNGTVYPSPRPREFDPLAYLARYFDLIEIDSTFYRPASPRSAASWARRVEANPRFRFTAKLWRGFTHDAPAGSGMDEAARIFRAGLAPLREAGRLACVLAQFPHSFRPGGEAWALIESLAARFGDMGLVVEVRRAEWATPATFERLRSLGAGLCQVDQPRIGRGGGATLQAVDWPGDDSLPRAATAYVRLHGRNEAAWFDSGAGRDGRYDWLYDAPSLREWVERIGTIGRRADETHVILNNHFRGKAVVNALMIRAMIEGRVVDAPEGLAALYPEAAPFLPGPGQGRLFS